MDEGILLKTEGLCVCFGQGEKVNPVVDEISFSLNRGEILGIAGESGSGKSMTALAVMGLLPRSAAIQKGRILYEGRDILASSKEERRRDRGQEYAMIFQEPMTSLNPVMTIGSQVEEMLFLHQSACGMEGHRAGRYKRTIEMLKEAGLKEAEKLYGQYPHQLSGGMRQRVMIAMAMICRPRLLIADEPTTALDVTIQAQILKLIKRLNREYGTSVILISHDLGVIKSICDRALVMADGKIVEEGSVHSLFYHPVEEYTKRLLAAVPRRERTERLLEEYRIREEKLNHAPPVLAVEKVNAYYREPGIHLFQNKKRIQVLKDVNLELRKGETLGIVGESGSGKTTLAKAVTGLLGDMDGQVNDYGTRPCMVFQDPYGSLNPARKVGWLLEEPLKIIGGFTREERQQRVRQIIEEVGLKERHLDRYVSQLSGGQRQRVGIACALIGNPGVLILDEPVSALDVTVQAQILSLLSELREKHGLSYLFISHDLNVIYQMCDRVAVMYHGEIVEIGSGKDIYEHPGHPYTGKLLEAVPKI